MGLFYSLYLDEFDKLNYGETMKMNEVSVMKWYKFDQSKGSKQKRPSVRKHVLVKLKSKAEGLPEGIAIGYMKNAAGDKQCPYFVTPGIGDEAVAWCDCLPENFKWPSGL